MKLMSIFDAPLRLLKGQESPWKAFFLWYLLGNILMMLFFYDISKWIGFSYFEKNSDFPYAVHYNFVDSVLTLFLLITGVATFICGMRAETRSGKIASGMTVAAAIFLLVFMAKVGGIPPEMEAELQGKIRELERAMAGIKDPVPGQPPAPAPASLQDLEQGHDSASSSGGRPYKPRRPSPAGEGQAVDQLQYQMMLQREQMQQGRGAENAPPRAPDEHNFDLPRQ